MNPDWYVGKVCAFYAMRGAVDRCMPRKGFTRLVGSIISAKRIANAMPGDIPNCELTVRGRSGKTVTVDMVEQHAAVFDTWTEALINATEPHPCAHKTAPSSQTSTKPVKSSELNRSSSSAQSTGPLPGMPSAPTSRASEADHARFRRPAAK